MVSDTAQETFTRHYIQYGTQHIDFGLTYAPRKTLGIHVYPDTSITVIAPENATLEKIYEKIRKKAPWIVKQQRFFESVAKAPVAREFVSGETFRYMGRQYRLRIRELENNRGERVKLKGKFFYASVKDPSNTHRIKNLLNEWFKTHAKQKFRERLDHCYRQMQRENLPYPELELRTMKTRWGSCSQTGRILLNPELIQHPVYCIDYVIIHELCHLVHPNHSKAFYTLKEKYLPDWERRKARLEG